MQYAGYANSEKQYTLQTCVIALGGALDKQIQIAKDKGSLDLRSDVVIEIMTPLLTTVKDLSIRPVVYPSALLCLTTAHRLIMLLDMIMELDDNFYKDTQVDWIKAVKDLRKRDSKWAKLSTAVPGTLVQLLGTQLELAIMSIPDPNVSCRANDFSLPAIANYSRLKITISPPCHHVTNPAFTLV